MKATMSTATRVSALLFQLLVVSVGAPSAHAALFTATVGGECGAQSGPNTTGAVAEVKSCLTQYHDGSASAQANSGGLHAYADYTHFGGTAGGLGGNAGVTTFFMLSGPEGSVETSLNLTLGGTVDPSTTAGGAYNHREINLSVGFGGAQTFVGALWFNGHNGTFGTSGLLEDLTEDCSSPCTLITPILSFPTNTWIALSMQLTAFIGSDTQASSGWANALHTLYFPLNGPVFNLPEGYSADIEGMNVVNNRVVQVSGVPEPGTFGLMGSALAWLGLLAWRRRTPAVSSGARA